MDKELESLLIDTCQLIDGWNQDGVWSEWDQSVRNRIAAYLSWMHFKSHKWNTHMQRVDYGSGAEPVVYCEVCGCEDQGDPSEFPKLVYPFCGQPG